MRERLSDGRFQLELWPSRLYALPVAIFTFLWLRFLWRWYALILLANADDARGFLVLFGLPFMLAGMSLVATSLRLALGRSLVAIDATRLVVAEQTLFEVRPPTLVAPLSGLRGFVASASEYDQDTWHVLAEPHEGEPFVLPLPVRARCEAEMIARRLERALTEVRAPQGYRGGPGAA